MRLGNRIKEKDIDTIEKVYKHCLQLDVEKTGYIELQVFSNIICYNLPEISSELMVTFQHEWNILTNEKIIDYNRYFLEYVGYEMQM